MHSFEFESVRIFKVVCRSVSDDVCARRNKALLSDTSVLSG